jgi:glycosyltransferase involved in cell wall biosynthesis
MKRVLHILPHPGGGGEVIVDMLSGLSEYEHVRSYLTDTRKPLWAAPSIARGFNRIRGETRHADLLHVVGDTSTIICAPLFGRHPAVWGTHGLNLVRRMEGLPGRLVRHRVRAAIAASRRTICSSQQEFRELSALAGPALTPKLTEVTNAVPLATVPTPEERAEARRQLGLDGDTLVGLFLGGLESHKRPLDAAAAVSGLMSRGIPAVLLVAGSGPLEAPLVSRKDSVRVLGFQSDPRPLFAAADVFLMPSEREGLPLALLEAMGHGVAVVASDAPGNADVVGDAGVMYPTGDVDRLTEILNSLATDVDGRCRLAHSARTRAEKQFSFDGYIAAMRTVFEAAIS